MAKSITPTDHDTTARQIVQQRGGGAVERCHGIRHQGSYSNAQHQWGVAILMYNIWPEDFPRLAIHCLSHDLPELLVGDIPAPALRYVPGLRDGVKPFEIIAARQMGVPSEHSLSEEDHLKLKVCDRLEFWLWCREQETIGNMYASEGRREVERYLIDIPEEARLVMQSLKTNAMLPKQAGLMSQYADWIEEGAYVSE